MILHRVLNPLRLGCGIPSVTDDVDDPAELLSAFQDKVTLSCCLQYQGLMQPLRGVCYETGPRNATSCMSAFCRGAAWPFKGKPGFVVFFTTPGDSVGGSAVRLPGPGL